MRRGTCDAIRAQESWIEIVVDKDQEDSGLEVKYERTDACEHYKTILNIKIK
jgi:hypothetical protein